jgi:hypothetical protein
MWARQSAEDSKGEGTKPDGEESDDQGWVGFRSLPMS